MYNEIEQDSLNELDKILNEGNEYVTILPGTSKILKFILMKTPKEVERPYNEQMIKKIRFIVIEQGSDNKEKFFYVGRRSARLIYAKLKEGYTLLKIERVGSKKDTMYIPTIVENNNE